MTWLIDDKVNVEKTERLSNFQVVGQCILNTCVTELIVVTLITTPPGWHVHRKGAV